MRAQKRRRRRARRQDESRVVFFLGVGPPGLRRERLHADCGRACSFSFRLDLGGSPTSRHRGVRESEASRLFFSAYPLRVSDGLGVFSPDAFSFSKSEDGFHFPTSPAKRRPRNRRRRNPEEPASDSHGLVRTPSDTSATTDGDPPPSLTPTSRSHRETSALPTKRVRASSGSRASFRRVGDASDRHRNGRVGSAPRRDPKNACSVSTKIPPDEDMADMSFALDGIVESFSPRRSVSSAVSSAEPRRGVEFRVATRNSSARARRRSWRRAPERASRAFQRGGVHALGRRGDRRVVLDETDMVAAGRRERGGRGTGGIRRFGARVAFHATRRFDVVVAGTPPGPTQEPCAVRGERDATARRSRSDTTRARTRGRPPPPPQSLRAGAHDGACESDDVSTECRAPFVVNFLGRRPGSDVVRRPQQHPAARGADDDDPRPRRVLTCGSCSRLSLCPGAARRPPGVAPSGWACEDAVFDQHGDPKIYARAEVDPAPAGDAPRGSFSFSDARGTYERRAVRGHGRSCPDDPKPYVNIGARSPARALVGRRARSAIRPNVLAFGRAGCRHRRRARRRANANRRRRRPRGDSRAHAAPVRVPGGHGDDRVVGARARSNAVRVRGVVPRASARPSRGPERPPGDDAGAGAGADARTRNEKADDERLHNELVYHIAM